MQIMPAASEERATSYRRNNKAAMHAPSSSTTSMMKAPRSPMRSPRARVRGPTTTGLSNRLYKAPQASIRTDSSCRSTPQKDKTSPTGTGNARRRRRAEGRQQGEGTGFAMDRQQSDNSIRVLDEVLPEPPLWSEQEALLQSSSPDLDNKTPTLSRRTIGTSSHVGGYAFEHDRSERSRYGDDDSFTGYTHSHLIEEVPRHLPKQNMFRTLRLGGMLQLLVILCLGVFVYDSHRTVAGHKEKLAQYDEERNHILEQMMWIDKAAKKVHKKYASLSDLNDIQNESQEELIQDVEDLKGELEQLQLRIQTNAREQIRLAFGDRPVQVSLNLDSAAEGAEHQHLVIAVSEDTPHAAHTLLQQIELHMWDSLLIDSQPGYVQIATRDPNTTPLLEFSEKSRGCKEFGSVSLRQVEIMALHVLVLRVNLDEHTPSDENDVCIGKVVAGMEKLQSLTQHPKAVVELEGLPMEELKEHEEPPPMPEEPDT